MQPRLDDPVRRLRVSAGPRAQWFQHRDAAEMAAHGGRNQGEKHCVQTRQLLHRGAPV